MTFSKLRFPIRKMRCSLRIYVYTRIVFSHWRVRNVNADEYDMETFIDIVSINPGLHRMRNDASLPPSPAFVSPARHISSFFPICPKFFPYSKYRKALRWLLRSSRKRMFRWHLFQSLLLEYLKPEALTGHSVTHSLIIRLSQFGYYYIDLWIRNIV